MRKPRLHVIGIAGPVVILGVAGVTVRRGSFKTIVGMTGLAIEGGVNTRKREIRESRVIEFCSHPIVHAVTESAIGREAKSLVVEHLRLEILAVAREALRGETHELPNRRAGMARGAVEGGVCGK